MQLDKTYIAIRERDLLDLCDLSLHVIRSLFVPLLICFAVGLVPAVLCHHWLFGGFDTWQLEGEDWNYEADWRFGAFWWSIVYVAWIAPFVTAPATLYLGQAMFMDRPQPQRIFSDWLKSLPQLIFFQVIIRGFMIIACVTMFLPFAVWPYLSEIILLERNPLIRTKRNKITTVRRSTALHGASFGDLFGRWLAMATLATLLAGLLFSAMWAAKFWVTGSAEISRLTYLLFFELSLWATACYFTVVRFLAYLDQRIRREGWEVELKMRAEAARMAGQLV